jgi:Uma2 family endonuclease
MATEILPDSAASPSAAFPLSLPSLPPLEAGDRLTRDEFERRYEAMPEVKKAELIEGVVYMPSPVKNSHGEPHSWIVGWLFNYCAATPSVRMSDNATVRLDADNEPQPDVQLRIDPACGGQTTLGPEDYIEGAPELIVEIAGSSASYDLHDKLEAYRRNGVREYVVWRVYERGIDWFSLEDEEYVALQPDEQGIFRSRVCPGLWLDRAAMLGGNLAGVLAVLQQGLSSPEHDEFARRTAGKEQS